MLGQTKKLAECVARYCQRRWGRLALIATGLGAMMAFWFSLPAPLFQGEPCVVLEATKGELLGARVANDGQYRFPEIDSLPPRMARCILLFEDRLFQYHPGLNPASLLRALRANLRAKRVVQGGSTITMQVARMLHPQAPRTIANKLLEAIWAMRLECAYSKDEILRLWASHAPFGGNVVGVEAAAWRYYGTPVDKLSWGQMATLAVLPNAPSRLRPGGDTIALRARRDDLLQRLYRAGDIDSLTLQLSIGEPLPLEVYPLPQHALQLMLRLGTERKGRYRSTLSYPLQLRAERIVGAYRGRLCGGSVRNAAAIIAEVKTGRVLAYVPNMPNLGDEHGGYVDLVMARRSSASTLKPLLYAHMLEEGEILPTQLLVDIPTTVAGFSPANADLLYRGVVPARDALSQSLNIPMVRLLQRAGVPSFLELLRRFGITTIPHSADHYGLSLILGGAEVCLWELTGLYASLARISREEGGVQRLTLEEEDLPTEGEAPLGRGACYLTLEAMRGVTRPREEIGWEHFGGRRDVAWKTGTSYGGRDAWAVAIVGDYAVGVWTGNADGQGVPDLSGVRTAGPILFDLIAMLPAEPEAEPPYGDLQQLAVCTQSGHPRSTFCPTPDTILIPRRGLRVPACPYHLPLHLDETGRWRVSSARYRGKVRVQTGFVLPPAAAYYAQRAGLYSPPPPWLPTMEEGEEAFEFIYPRANRTSISVPRGVDGVVERVLFHVAYGGSGLLYWHLDGVYVGTTRDVHQLLLAPSEGPHRLSCVNEGGRSRSIDFTVVYRAKD